MTTLVVPPLDDHPWPTLGPALCDFLEERAVFGPGSLKGQPAVIDDEKRSIIYRAYEVYPRGHEFAGRRRFRRVAVSLRKGTAKCLDGSVLLTMADGTRRRADQVTPGEWVLSWSGAELVPARVAHAWSQPPAARYRITTAHGREVTVTGDHPFLVQGTRWEPGMPSRRRYLSCDPAADSMQWVKAEDLRDTDRLVTALGWAGDGDGGLNTDDAWVLGAIVGDGGGDGRFTNADPEVLDRLRERFTLSPLRADRYSYYLRGVRPLLREHGLYGCDARSKAVPAAVYSSGRASIAAFLAGYLDTDGHVKFEPLAGGKVRAVVEWASINRDLLEQCQHLLTGIGVNASLHVSRSRYKGEPYTSWKLSITDQSQAAVLADELSALALTRKRNALHAIRDRAGRCSFAGRQLDRVRTVERLPDGPSYAVEVAEHHTHITAGLVTHNTELGAWVSYLELHPEAPVRCDGFDQWGRPVGRPVRNPYIPMMAYTEEQVEELAYGALYTVVTEGPDADLFDAGLDRIIRLDHRGRADGKAEALANSPAARDGARTTFQDFDETHRMHLPRQVDSYETMMANLDKRPLDDPWSLEHTTAGQLGQGSVAENTHIEAEQIAAGLIEDPELFYLHRFAGPGHDMKSIDGRIGAIREATGPLGEYGPGQFRGIAKQWNRPKADKKYLERVWLNRWETGDAQAFDLARWALPYEQGGLARAGDEIPHRALVAAGFDGARFRDSTAIVLTDIRTGLQQKWACWERPAELDPDAEWEVPEDEVTDAWAEIRRRFRLWKAYCDPPHWTETVGSWEARWPDQFEEWWTNRRRPMAEAIRAYTEAQANREVTHTDDPTFNRHIGNAGKDLVNLWDDDGKQLYILKKLHPTRKFDVAMAGCLSWRAYLDAIKSDALKQQPERYPAKRLR